MSEAQRDKFTLRLDTSQLVQWMKCPTYHDFVSVKNIIKKFVSKEAMDRGTVFHGLLERYYSKLWEGEQWSPAMNFALSEINTLKKDVKLKDEDYKLLVLRFTDYVIKYHKDKIEVLTYKDAQGTKKPALEMGFSVPLVDTKFFYFVLEGRIDMIATMSNQLVIWDHKAQGRAYSLYGQSIQMLNYCLATGAKTAVYNYIRLHQKVQPNTFDQKLRSIPQWLLDQWRIKLINTFYHIADLKMNGSKIPDFPSQSCSDIGFGRPCPYTSLCEERHPKIRQALIERDFMEKKPWEPWSLDEVEDLGE